MHGFSLYSNNNGKFFKFYVVFKDYNILFYNRDLWFAEIHAFLLYPYILIGEIATDIT